jgi:short-subunit dehydrogenase
VALPEPAESSTALITGASAGIGEATARELAARGHGVTLVARREERLRSLAGDLSERFGVRAEAIGADLGSATARADLARRIDELGLEVEVLVNNAGFGTGGRFHELDAERELEMVRVNVEAVVDLCGHFVPAMAARGRGAVLNVASTAAFQPLPRQATYGATKAFVLSFTDALHATSMAPG